MFSELDIKASVLRDVPRSNGSTIDNEEFDRHRLLGEGELVGGTEIGIDEIGGSTRVDEGIS
jgi:hypothetical protein